MDAAIDPGFAAFAQAHQHRFLRAAYLVCGDQHLAQDLVQEALTKLALRWSSVQHQNPSGFVRTILYRDAVSTWRRTRLEDVSHQPPERPDRAADRAVAQRDARMTLLPALRALPPRQRAVIVLRYFEELTETEAADVLGISVGTVKSQTHDALATLRRSLPDLQVTTTRRNR